MCLCIPLPNYIHGVGFAVKFTQIWVDFIIIHQPNFCWPICWEVGFPLPIKPTHLLLKRVGSVAGSWAPKCSFPPKIVWVKNRLSSSPHPIKKKTTWDSPTLIPTRIVNGLVNGLVNVPPCHGSVFRHSPTPPVPECSVHARDCFQEYPGCAVYHDHPIHEVSQGRKVATFIWGILIHLAKCFISLSRPKRPWKKNRLNGLLFSLLNIYVIPKSWSRLAIGQVSHNISPTSLDFPEIYGIFSLTKPPFGGNRSGEVAS